MSSFQIVTIARVGIWDILVVDMAGVPNIPSSFDKPYMVLLGSLFKFCVFIVPGFLWVSLYGKNLFGENSPQIYIIAPLIFSAIFLASGIMGYALVIVLNQKVLDLFLLREYRRELRELRSLQYGSIHEPSHPPAWSEKEYRRLRKLAEDSYWIDREEAFGGTAIQVPRLGSLIGSILSTSLWLCLLYLKSRNIFHLSMGWATFICISLVFFVAILAATLIQIPRVRTLPRKLAIVGVFIFLCLAFYLVTTNFVNTFS